TVFSGNITPDLETGIGAWSKEMFIQRFKSSAPMIDEKPSKDVIAFNTVMPWAMYSGMKAEDLGAIYSYLKTIAPIKNAVAGPAL
ncbi:MAG: cytochrome C, partial [Proteobacteria bacterium]|nr:cytochrome C [Pseudomonadota bacterium]